MMSAFESQLNTDTCEIVDGIGNQLVLDEGARQCISNQVSKGKTNREAREICFTCGDGVCDSPNDQADNITNKAGNKTARFSMTQFLDKAFPEEGKTVSGDSYHINSGGHVYTRKKRVREFALKLFPGVEIKGTASLQNGGTFDPQTEDAIREDVKETNEYVYKVLGFMHELQGKGFDPQTAIAKAAKEFNWYDKSKWKSKGLPPLFRPNRDTSDPEMLITPEQIYSLLPLVTKYKSVDPQKNPALSQVVNRITKSVAQIRKVDELSDIYSGFATECNRLENQDKVTQHNCEFAMKNINFRLDVLNKKMEAEERARRAQLEVTQYVQSVVRSLQLEPRHQYASPDKGSIPTPGKGL